MILRNGLPSVSMPTTRPGTEICLFAGLQELMLKQQQLEAQMNENNMVKMVRADFAAAFMHGVSQRNATITPDNFAGV